MGPVRVLVVEDEKRLGDAIRRGLVAEGFVVDVETNGADGLWAAQNHPYDVIVLDIMLPKLNGYDVCRQLRADENWTPVIMLTAKDGDLDQVDAFDLGADDYLTKPFVVRRAGGAAASACPAWRARPTGRADGGRPQPRPGRAHRPSR